MTRRVVRAVLVAASALVAVVLLSGAALADTGASLSSVKRGADGTVTGTLTVSAGTDTAVVDMSTLRLVVEGQEYKVDGSPGSTLARSTILLIDRSGSMRDSGMSTVRSSVAQFFEYRTEGRQSGGGLVRRPGDAGPAPDVRPRRCSDGGQRPEVRWRHGALRRGRPGGQDARRHRRPQHRPAQRRQGHHEHDERSTGRAAADLRQRRPHRGDRLPDQHHGQPRPRVPRSSRWRHRHAGRQCGRSRRGLHRRCEGARQPGVVERKDPHLPVGHPAGDPARQRQHRHLLGLERRGLRPSASRSHPECDDASPDSDSDDSAPRRGCTAAGPSRR